MAAASPYRVPEGGTALERQAGPGYRPAEGNYVGSGSPAVAARSRGSQDLARRLDIDLRKQELEAIMKQVRDIGQKLVMQNSSVLSFRPPPRGAGPGEAAAPPPAAAAPRPGSQVLVSPYMAGKLGLPAAISTHPVAVSNATVSQGDPPGAAATPASAEAAALEPKLLEFPSAGSPAAPAPAPTAAAAPADASRAVGGDTFGGELPAGGAAQRLLAANQGGGPGSPRSGAAAEGPQGVEVDLLKAKVADLQRQLFHSMSHSKTLSARLNEELESKRTSEASTSSALDSAAVSQAEKAAAETAAKHVADEAAALRKEVEGLQQAKLDLEMEYSRNFKQKVQEAAETSILLSQQKYAEDREELRDMVEEHDAIHEEMAALKQEHIKAMAESERVLRDLEARLRDAEAARVEARGREKAALAKLGASEEKVAAIKLRVEELTPLAGKLQGMQEDYARVVEQLQNSEGRTDAAKSKWAGMQQSLEASTKRAFDLEAEAEELKAQLRLAADKVEMLEKVRATAQEAEARLHEELQQQTRALAEKSSEAEGLRRRVGALEEDGAQRAAAAKDLEAQLEEAQQQSTKKASKSQAQLKSLENTIAELSAAFREKERECGRAEEARAKLERDVDAAREGQRAALEKSKKFVVQVEELEQEGAAAKAARDRIEANYKAAAATLKAELEEARDEAKGAKEESQMVGLNVSLLEQQVTELEGRVKRRNATIDDLDRKLRGLTKEASAAQEQREEEARRAKAAADGAAEAAQAAGASEAKVRALEEQVKQLEDEMLEKDGLINILRDNLREQETSFTAS